LPFVVSKNRIGVRPGMALSLPVVLRITLGSLLVCPKIVASYEEKIWTESQPGERFASLNAIPWAKGLER
jgi:hypothetical protein